MTDYIREKEIQAGIISIFQITENLLGRVVRFIGWYNIRKGFSRLYPDSFFSG